MPKRRANGEGNIRKRKDGRWEGATPSVTIRKPARPSSRMSSARRSRGQGKTEKSHRGKRRHRLRTGQDLHRGKLAGGLDGKLRKIKLRPSTFKTSQGFLKTTSSRRSAASRWQIALLWTCSGSTSTCWTAAGRPHRGQEKAERLAPKTVRNIHQMIGSAYNLAIEQRLVTKNPTQGCALPKVEHKEMKTLTADQLSAFFQRPRTAACTSSTTSTSPRDCGGANCWAESGRTSTSTVVC